MFVTRCAFAAVQFSKNWADARVDKESRRPKIEQGDNILSSLGVINQEILARSAVYALHESYHACIVQNLGLAWRPLRMRRSGPHPQGVISGEPEVA
jgi:hypothetical protein